MKRTTIVSFLMLAALTFLIAASAGHSEVEVSSKQNGDLEMKEYWFAGNAEISSYKLSQARYGEMREGSAVLVYVTEPFSKTANTKADKANPTNISVLKLNATKNFLTGIYPYTMMNSTFFPFENGNTSLKSATSIQEWCGMAYLEMKQEDQLVFNLNSYFEGRSFRNKKIDKVILEDDLWSLIRLNPKQLPIGEHLVMPSAFYMLLKHKEIKPLKASIKLYIGGEGGRNYEISYPESGRVLTIKFEMDFPYKIIGWEEIYSEGYGANKKVMTTKAELIKTIKSDYWNQNSNQDKFWRDTLGLK